LQIIFVGGTTIYVGGMAPIKFNLIVIAPNNLPYFLNSPPAHLLIDLNKEKN